MLNFRWLAIFVLCSFLSYSQELPEKKFTVKYIADEIKLDALFFDSNGAVRTKVSSESNAIGYLSLGYVGELKALSLDGVEPTIDNCKSGKYPVLRRLYLLTREVPEGSAKNFLDFCRSDEGQQIAEEEGYIPLVK